MDQIDRKILRTLEKDARTPSEDLATICGIGKDEVSARVAAMERDGIIRGYKGVVDWERVDSDRVTAIIEVKVTPKAGLGFEDVAARVARYPEVESVSLMSGAYDLNVVVKGKTFHEVAAFVAHELSVLDSVTSTATQFVMRRYKEFDVRLIEEESDGREKISL